MDLRVLEYFLMVAGEENVSHAADILHVSQPTISRQLMQLEAEVGKTLFVRGNKNMTLTKEGQFFKRRAEEILELYQRTLRDMSGGEEDISGELFVGSGETDAFSALAGVICDFQKDHPRVRFHITSGDSDALKEEIDRGVLDIGFLFEPVNISKYACVRTRIVEHWGVVTLPGHELAAKSRVTVEDLLGENLIVPRRMAFQSEIFRWFGRAAADLEIRATYNLINKAVQTPAMETFLSYLELFKN